MFLESLSLHNFRNIAQLELTIPAQGVLLQGNNGQGKTSILEALYLCATGRSFRTQRVHEMIRHGESAARISARFIRRGVRHVIDVSLQPKHRVITVDDKRLPATSSLLQMVNIVAFFPDDLCITKGPAEGRRHFVDRMVANIQSDFLMSSVNYAKVLKSRNHVLRQSQNGIDPVLMKTLDEQLIGYGEKIHTYRSQTLKALLPLAIEIYTEISMGKDPTPNMELTAGFLLSSEYMSDYKTNFKKTLEKDLPRDRALGMTSSGPHRADLFISLGNYNSRQYASQGQQRALVLALKLAEVHMLRSILESPPILLLDDVSSELDSERCSVLFNDLVQSEAQVWLSTTGAAKLPENPKMSKYEVTDGHVNLLNS